MEWQPIETAPLNMPILVAWKWPGGDYCVCVAQKSNKFGWWVVNDAGGYKCESEFECIEMTHWMPLPEAPK